MKMSNRPVRFLAALLLVWSSAVLPSEKPAATPKPSASDSPSDTPPLAGFPAAGILPKEEIGAARFLANAGRWYRSAMSPQPMTAIVGDNVVRRAQPRPLLADSCPLIIERVVIFYRHPKTPRPVPVTHKERGFCNYFDQSLQRSS